LKAAKRRKRENAGPRAIASASASESPSQSSWRCARADESRAIVASPSVEIRIAAAGRTSSRRTSSGARATHVIAPSASAASSHGGPIEPCGANESA